MKATISNKTLAEIFKNSKYKLESTADAVFIHLQANNFCNSYSDFAIIAQNNEWVEVWIEKNIYKGGN